MTKIVLNLGNLYFSIVSDFDILISNFFMYHNSMLARVNSSAIVGLDAIPVEVEIDIASQGFPAFTIVGLPDKARGLRRPNFPAMPI